MADQEERVVKENQSRVTITKARSDYVVKNDVVVAEVGQSAV